MNGDELLNSLDPETRLLCYWDGIIYGGYYLKQVAFGKWERIDPAKVRNLPKGGTWRRVQ
jgi:hypothetical protein